MFIFFMLLFFLSSNRVVMEFFRGAPATAGVPVFTYRRNIRRAATNRSVIVFLFRKLTWKFYTDVQSERAGRIFIWKMV